MDASKPVKDMSTEERGELTKKLCELITKHGLEEKLKIDTTRETVCALASAEVQDTLTVNIAGNLDPDLKGKFDAFKADFENVKCEGLNLKAAVQLGAGCKYDVIKDIVPVEGGDTPMNLEHKEGEVWMIDFWATWCPPCQKPMQHNEDMLKKNKDEWGDNVKIIGISIDQTKEAVAKHIEDKDWKRPVHYWRAKSDCSQQYSVSGVPNVMIIDKKGMIVFKGHPASRPDLEADFNTLLKDGEITGEGTAAANKPAAADDKEGDKKTEGKDLDPAESLKAIDEFKASVGPDLQKNEKISAVAKDMPRAFCVMVYEEKCDPKTAKSTVDWKNYRVLVGKQDSINTCKELIDEKVKGNFEIVLREHVI